MAKGGSGSLLIDDGILVWFDGPEWDEVAASIIENSATEVEEAARRNAPWADITGNARAGLSANVENNNGEIILTLYHTVEYGLWLEVIQNGAFATILPTLEREAPSILNRAAREVATARRGRA